VYASWRNSTAQLRISSWSRDSTGIMIFSLGGTGCAPDNPI
jgi:hypothetical protein